MITFNRFTTLFLVASGALVALAQAADVPQQIHIAFAGVDNNGDPNGMVVSWQTIGRTLTSTVRYGTSSSQLTSVAQGTQGTYYETFDHHVVLHNLQPSTQYFYQCGDANAGFSDILTFTTAPSQSTISYPINIAIFGDMGVYNSEDSRNTLQSMANNGQYDWIWHLGDISYADDDWLHNPLQDNYESTWNEYMNAIQGFAAKFPYMVMAGNHEAECHSPSCEVSRDKLVHLSNFSAYNHRFRMPSEESNGNSNMWYSFNYGPIHFINIDTETNYDGAPGDHYTWYGDNGNFWGNQMAWLEADLQKATEQRSIRPWIFVGGHRPVYSLHDADKNGYPDGVSKSLQTAVEELFHQYKVDVYWCGHVHGYERQWPVYQSTDIEVDSDYVDPEHTIYIVHGAAGNDEDHEKYALVPDAKWNVLFDNKHFGIGLLTVNSATSMSWKFLDAATNDVIDSFTFSKTKL